MEIRYASHDEDAKSYDTTQLRKHFLIEDLFAPGEIKMVYSHIDRIIVAGIVPTNKALSLEGSKALGCDYFLQRRELGVINIGGAGTVTLDGEKHQLGARDGLYVGLGIKQISFESNGR